MPRDMATVLSTLVYCITLNVTSNELKKIVFAFKTFVLIKACY